MSSIEFSFFQKMIGTIDLNVDYRHPVDTADTCHGATRVLMTCCYSDVIGPPLEFFRYNEQHSLRREKHLVIVPHKSPPYFRNCLFT